MYTGYIDRCMPSEMMRDYLKGCRLWAGQTMDLIMYAPVPISIKLEELKKLLEDAESDKGDERKSEIAEACRDEIQYIEAVLGCLNMEGVFTLELCEYLESEKDNESWLDGVFARIDDVKEYIREDIRKCKVEPDELKWYFIEKWIKTAEGKYFGACSYVIFRDEIIFADAEKEVLPKDLSDRRISHNYCYGENLNVPVPFKAGDLLEFDGFPFGPKCHVLIVDIGDNWDCCCVQGLALNSEGLWDVGAVKHGMVSVSYSPKISYLYSAKPYHGELEPEEQILLKIKDYIGGDSEKGKAVNEAIWTGPMTEEELTEALTGIAW